MIIKEVSKNIYPKKSINILVVQYKTPVSNNAVFLINLSINQAEKLRNKLNKLLAVDKLSTIKS